MALEIAIMTREDVDAVHAIGKACFSVPWSRAAFEREMDENVCARYLVGRADGRVVAFAGMWLIVDEAHVTNIAVLPDARGRGYGAAITSALIGLAADSGMAFMTLECRRSNAAAQALYRKLGFIDVGFRKRYYPDNNEDALVMLLESLPEGNPERDPHLIRL